jgi:prepilin-type N-terminal cleavage/methylation domain-containing protein
MKVHRIGFTLIELMIVIAILAVLMGILLPTISMVRQRSKLTQAKSTISVIAQACSVYRLQLNAWPPSQTASWPVANSVDQLSTYAFGIETDANRPRGLLDLLVDIGDMQIPGGYLTPNLAGWQSLRDPWGNPYFYQVVDPLVPATPGRTAFWKNLRPNAFGRDGNETLACVYSVGDANLRPSVAPDADGGGWWVSSERLLFTKDGQ